MADILTLAQARAALGWSVGTHLGDEVELAAEYIPAVTAIIEAPTMCGRMLDRVEPWRTASASPITTPWAAPVEVLRVAVDGAVITGWSWTAPVLTIFDARYAPGDVVTVTAANLPIPAPVKMAAKIILTQLWNADKQGVGSDSRPDATEQTPVGFAVPRRAEALLAPYMLAGGFA